VRFLRSLGEGDKFRPAHPRQVSLNMRPMPRSSVFKITKVFPQSPHLTISETEGEKGIFSLGPGTPVLLPKEMDPTERDIVKFLAPRGNKKVVGYKLLWDGKMELGGIATPQARAVLKLMFVMGKKEYGLTELNHMFDAHYETFLGKPSKVQGYHALIFYRRYLVDKGLIEEIVDDAPATQAVRDANLQEAL
jgi:hypothetical protein